MLNACNSEFLGMSQLKIENRDRYKMEQIETSETVLFGASLKNFDFIEYFCKMKYHIILAILFLSMIAPSYQVALFIFAFTPKVYIWTVIIFFLSLHEM